MGIAKAGIVGRISWRGVAFALGFLMLAVLLVVGSGFLLRALGIHFHDKSPVERPFSIFGTCVGLAAMVIATIAMAGIERRSWLDFGLRDTRLARHFMGGAAVGLGAFALLMLALWLLGGIAIRPGDVSASAAGFAAIWALGFLATGLFEEIAFRGYLLGRLGEAVGFPIAAILTSLLFGLVHLSSGFDAGVAIVDAVLIGGVLALSIRLTGSLWWAIGFHAAWDWAESYLFGAADSGLRVQGALLQSDPIGSPLLSGGSSGPEGSLITFAAILLATLFMTRRLARQG